jgi:hypothetical protein
VRITGGAPRIAGTANPTDSEAPYGDIHGYSAQRWNSDLGQR